MIFICLLFDSVRYSLLCVRNLPTKGLRGVKLRREKLFNRLDGSSKNTNALCESDKPTLLYVLLL